MDKILDAIKCQRCKNILKTPIILPCGHSMCKAHADDQSVDQVKCPKCGMSHPNQQFAVNSELSALVDSQIASLDFGPCHKKAKEACDKLDNILVLIGHMTKDPVYFSHQAIDELKNKVLLKSEQLKLEIDKRTDEMLTILSDYQKDCELNLREPPMESSLKNLEKIKIETEKMLNESLEILNQLRFDEERWKSIETECDCKVEHLNKQFESVKKQILMKEFEDNRAYVRHFCDADLNLSFPHGISWINSQILDFEHKNKLREICEISSQSKWTLLWRGSRDGFGARDFHSRCDNIPNTLTIIETTQGFIFGGYTEQLWNSFFSEYVRDPNAYIFSLVNDVGEPFLMKVKYPDYAIFPRSSYGPYFGFVGDICVVDNSHVSINSSSIIHSYCLPDNLKNKNVLAGSEKFQVKEIEVFQLV